MKKTLLHNKEKKANLFYGTKMLRVVRLRLYTGATSEGQYQNKLL